MSTYDPARREYMRAYMAKRRYAAKAPLSDADLNEIVRLYTVDKLGVDGIGKRFDRDGGTICYWLRKRGIERRAQGIRHSWSNRMRNRGYMAAARIAAEHYQDRTLISFPESPRLQADWLACLAKVKAERGADWRTLLLAGR